MHDAEFSLEDLNGTWICPKGVLHTIQGGMLFLAEGSSENFPETLQFRADRTDRHGPNHFSVGRRRRKGTHPSTLRRCILRSSCSLQWTSPDMQETWQRFVPCIARCEKILLVGPDGTDGTEVPVHVTKATNAKQLCTAAMVPFYGQLGVYCSDEIALTEVATGKVLTDCCDLSKSGDVQEPVKLRVSTCLANLISFAGVRLVYQDGSECKADLSRAYRVAHVFEKVAEHTSRPLDFVTLFQIGSGGKSEPLWNNHIWRARQDHKVVLEVHLRETVAELWSSRRLTLMRDGQDWHIDLSSTWDIGQLRELAASLTKRPPRFVRFTADGKELRTWDPNPGESILLNVQLCPTVTELCQTGVKIVSSLTGDEIPIAAEEATGLQSIQDLREHIARRHSMRPTGVMLLANAQPLWDAQIFDLSMLGAGDSIGVCLRNPKLCEEGQHDNVVFCSNGHSDTVCVHCGPLSLMSRHYIPEPPRTSGQTQWFHF